MITNSPAIRLAGDRWRSTGHKSLYFSQKTVTMQGCDGVVFAVRVQNSMSITRAARVDQEQVTSQGINSLIVGIGAVAIYIITDPLGGKSKRKNHD